MDSRSLSFRSYREDPRRLVRRLEQLIAARRDTPYADLALEMVDSVLSLVADGAARGDLKILNHSLRELRRAFKVFAPYRGVRKVSIFGSARTRAGTPEYEQARTFANRMTRLGHMVITGAGSGIMEAAQGGAGREKSFGVNIRLPFEQKANDVIQNDPKLLHFRYFFTRKVIFVKETDAIAVFPGGFGTHDEGFESLTLIQTGKTEPLPVVFVDRPGGVYWRDWARYIRRHLRDQGYIDPEDESLYTITDDVDRAVEVIQRFYSNYHSMRLVRSRLVVRLQRPLGDDALRRIQERFGDLLARGSFERLEAPLGEEADEPHTHHLSRIAFHFNRRSYARLRRLVDCLNDLGAAAAGADPSGGEGRKGRRAG